MRLVGLQRPVREVEKVSFEVERERELVGREREQPTHQKSRRRGWAWSPTGTSRRRSSRRPRRRKSLVRGARRVDSRGCRRRTSRPARRGRHKGRRVHRCEEGSESVRGTDKTGKPASASRGGKVGDAHAHALVAVDRAAPAKVALRVARAPARRKRESVSDAGGGADGGVAPSSSSPTSPVRARAQTHLAPAHPQK